MVTVPPVLQCMVWAIQILETHSTSTRPTLPHVEEQEVKEVPGVKEAEGEQEAEEDQEAGVAEVVPVEREVEVDQVTQL